MRIGFLPRPNLATSAAADDESGGRHAQHHTPDLHREQREAVGIHERHEHPAGEVVEGGEEDQRKEPLSGPDSRDACLHFGQASVPALPQDPGFGNPDGQQMDQHHHDRHQRDDDGAAHAEHADGQAAEDAGDQERDALHGAHQPVGVRPLRGRDQQGHGG